MVIRTLENKIHKDRFERSKAFSDYLGFHIRATFFLVIAMFALAIPVSNMLVEANGGPQYDPTDHILELSVMMFCFFLSLTMLFHIFGVGRSFLKVEIPRKTLRWVMYPFYWMLTAGAMGAISFYGTFQLTSTLGVDFPELECAMNSYLSKTEYPFTPEKPERCR